MAEAIDKFDAAGPATIPFCLQAPPEPGLALMLIAGFVIAVYSFAAGYCVAMVALNVQRESTAFFAAIGFLPACAAAWSQLLGVFRPHAAWANFAGNLLIGSAALVAAALAGIPLVAAQPILLSELLGYGGMTIFLSIAGHLNLAWSRQLQSAGWKAPGGWTFSLRELLAIFTAIAVSCGGYMLCARSAVEANLREQWRHEQWRQQRIIDGQIEKTNRARFRPSNPTATSTTNRND